MTKAEKLQKQLDEIRKNCKHSHKMLRKNGNVTDSIPVHCRACASDINLDPSKYCKECWRKTMKQDGTAYEDLPNSSTCTDYVCKKCNHRQTISESMI